ncbi:hypothetical protein [Prauserella rugosa]|nr:hypothetical protein [Prauserella rugosa]
MRVRKKFSMVTLPLATAAILGGCGTEPDDSGVSMDKTITIQQANDKLEEHLERSHSAFPDSATFEEFSKYENSPCEDPGDPGPKGKKFASRIYQVRNVPADGIKDQFTTAKQWWTSNGYQVTHEDDELLSVINTEDEYKLGLRTNRLNELFLLGDSPCVWPNGTPQPED